MKRNVLFLMFFLFTLAPCWALGPHEILLIANSRSDDSTHVAETYRHLRGIAEQNYVVIPVDMPDAKDPAIISRESFTSQIWDPVNALIRERGLEKQILAWVYSCDFPIAIQTDPKVSLMGITFLRNELPGQRMVQRGLYVSPLFAGPSTPDGPMFGSQTFDLYDEWLVDDMPLPSMMLGVTGKGGNTVSEILKYLHQGAASDGALPRGSVHFVFTDDIRSRCRKWQYARSVAELGALGISTQVHDTQPAALKGVLGMHMGAPRVHPERYTFAPGAVAEHLTSEAAMFHQKRQSKVSEWLRAGATGSAGTVTEPLAIWEKFPHLRFSAHYGAGCTMMESFYQSIKCPLQILLVGEPLASPWADAPELTIKGIGTGDVSGYVTVSAEAKEKARYGKFTYILDGKLVHHGARLALDTRTLSNGLHTLRVVAYRIGLVRSQIHNEKAFRVRNPVAGN